MMRKKPWVAFLILGLSFVLVLGGCMHTKIENNNPQGWRAAMQPAIDEQTSRSLAATPSLRQSVELAVHRNPGVESKRREWLAMIHTEPQQLSLPDPQLYQLAYDFTGNDFMSGQIMQMIPWPQKIWANGKIAATDADIARLQYEIALRDLIVEVKSAWYELYYLDRATSITTQIETIFRNEAQLAYQQLGSGKTQLSEAFRAESQAAQLAYDRILLAEQCATQAETLKALLNLPPGTVIGPVRAAPVYAVSSEITPLYGRADQYAQILKVRGLDSQKARYQTFLARLARIPDVTPALMVQGPTSNLSYIGMLTANLPIWEYRNRAMIREKQAAEESMRRMALEETNQTRRGVAQAYFLVELTQRLITLYAKTLLPQAESVMRQAEIDFRAGLVSFSSVLETTLAWHNFQLAYHRAVADHGQAIGRLEQVLGTTAESRPQEDKNTKP